MANPALFTVTESFVGTLDGREVEYHKGEVVEAGDPAIKKMPNHFEPVIIRGGQTRSVEQATAAPGEKRRLSVRRKAKVAPEPEPEPTPEPTPEPEPEPEGKAITTTGFKGR